MATYLLSSGELVDAPTALRAGLVDSVVEAEHLTAQVSRFYRETITAGELAEAVSAFAEHRPPRFR